VTKDEQVDQAWSPSVGLILGLFLGVVVLLVAAAILGMRS
jgi:hypothetical protein